MFIQASSPQRPLSWVGIIRLGLVQTALGAIVVITTSAINRVMNVELALPAIIPGLLVALHHAVQMLRPRWGYSSDGGGRLTPWIIGGMAVLAVGGIGAAVAISWMSISFAWEAYMNKELVRSDPMAHVRIFLKDTAHLLQLITPWRSKRQ